MNKVHNSKREAMAKIDSNKIQGEDELSLFDSHIQIFGGCESISQTFKTDNKIELVCKMTFDPPTLIRGSKDLFGR